MAWAIVTRAKVKPAAMSTYTEDVVMMTEEKEVKMV